MEQLQHLRQKLDVQLCSMELWRKFHNIGTEMIITKSGRRMFPPVRVRVSGLEPDELYSIFLELELADDRRYRFAHETGQWQPSKATSVSAPATTPRSKPGAGVVAHPLAPATGHLWAAQGVVSFDRLKLTNTKHPVLRDHVPLLSMHRYFAKIHVMLSNPTALKQADALNLEEAVTFAFPMTTFIAVTAYQNREITKLKSACNPFATGVRLSKVLSNSRVPNNPGSCSPNQVQLQLTRKRMEPTLEDETNYAYTGIQDKYADTRLKDKYIRQKLITAEPNEPFLFNPKTSHKNCISSYYDRSNSGIFEDFRLMYPKVPIKFVIPPLCRNLMLDWTAAGETEIVPLI